MLSFKKGEEKFPKNEEIEALFTPYGLSFIEEFLNSFEYDWKSQFLDFGTCTEEEFAKEGFKFFLSAGGEKGIFYLQTNHYLVFAKPEKVIEDFNRFLNLKIFI